MTDYEIKIPCGDALCMLRHNWYRPDKVPAKYTLVKDTFYKPSQSSLIFKLNEKLYALPYTTLSDSFGAQKFLGEDNIDENGLVTVAEVELTTIPVENYYSKSWLEANK